MVQKVTNRSICLEHEVGKKKVVVGSEAGMDDGHLTMKGPATELLTWTLDL